MLNCGWLFWFCCGMSLMELPSGQLSLWCREQRVEAARPVERGEVVVAADVALPHVDLRHGAPAGALDHLLAARRIEVHADLLDLGHALGAQQPLGHQAVRAYAGGIHQDLRHHFSRGRLACCHAARPPFRWKTDLKPARRSSFAAVAERLPFMHVTSTGFSLYFSISGMRLDRSPTGMCRARGRCPDANSCASRTSSTRVVPWFMRRVASSVPSSPAPPAKPSRSGATSIVTLARKRSTSGQLSRRNSPTMGRDGGLSPRIKGRFYPIDPCNSQSDAMPAAMGASGWRKRAPAASATSPAMRRRLCAERST